MTPTKKKQFAFQFVVGLMASSALWMSRHVFENMRSVDTVLVLATGVLFGVWLTSVGRYVFNKD